MFLIEILSIAVIINFICIAALIIMNVILKAQIRSIAKRQTILEDDFYK